MDPLWNGTIQANGNFGEIYVVYNFVTESFEKVDVYSAYDRLNSLCNQYYSCTTNRTVAQICFNENLNLYYAKRPDQVGIMGNEAQNKFLRNALPYWEMFMIFISIIGMIFCLNVINLVRSFKCLRTAFGIFSAAEASFIITILLMTIFNLFYASITSIFVNLLTNLNNSDAGSIIRSCLNYFNQLSFAFAHIVILIRVTKSLSRFVAVYLPFQYNLIFSLKNTLLILFLITFSQLLIITFIIMIRLNIIKFESAVTACPSSSPYVLLNILLFYINGFKICFPTVYTAFQAFVAIIASIFFDIAAIWRLHKILKTNEFSKLKQQQEKSLLILTCLDLIPFSIGLFITAINASPAYFPRYIFYTFFLPLQYIFQENILNALTYSVDMMIALGFLHRIVNLDKNEKHKAIGTFSGLLKKIPAFILQRISRLRESEEHVNSSGNDTLFTTRK